MSGTAKIYSSSVSVNSDITMDLTSYAGMSMTTEALLEEKEAKERDNPHAPVKPDDPHYPNLHEEVDEYETDASSDMEDEIIDGVVIHKKKHKDTDATKTAGKAASEFVRRRQEMQENLAKELKGLVMHQMEDYSALDAPPPPKRPGKFVAWCTRMGKFFGCTDLDLHEAVLSGSDKHLDSALEKVHQGKKSRRHLLNQYNSNGETALSLAVKSKQTNMAFAIMGRKVDPDVPDTDTGRTPLFYACTQGLLNLNILLLSNGADPNFGDFSMVTPLMIAARRDDYRTVSYICNMKKRLDLDAQDMNGWTALHFAASKNSSRAIKELLDNGINRQLKDANGRKALHIARYKDFVESVAYLEDVKSRLAFFGDDDDDDN